MLTKMNEMRRRQKKAEHQVNDTEGLGYSLSPAGSAAGEIPARRFNYKLACGTGNVPAHDWPSAHPAAGRSRKRFVACDGGGIHQRQVSGQDSRILLGKLSASTTIGNTNEPNSKKYLSAKIRPRQLRFLSAAEACHTRDETTKITEIVWDCLRGADGPCRGRTGPPL